MPEKYKNEVSEMLFLGWKIWHGWMVSEPSLTEFCVTVDTSLFQPLPD